jgi:cytochrome c556
MSATRALVLFIAGLFLGSLASFIMAGALQQRHAVPKGTMALMQYHYSQARQTAQANACDAPAALKHVSRLRVLAEDAQAIFAAIGYTDATFERRRQAFLTEVDRAIAAGGDCAGISTALKQINDACAGCHHETR